MDGRERIKEILLEQMELLQEEGAKMIIKDGDLVYIGSLCEYAKAMKELTIAYCQVDAMPC